MHSSVEALDEAIDSLRGRVSETVVTTFPDSPDAAAVRGWRATLDAQHSESQRRIARLSALAKDATRLAESRAALTSIREELALKELILASAEDNRLETEKELQGAEKRLAHANLDSLSEDRIR
jgi:hypothetical protein